MSEHFKSLSWLDLYNFLHEKANDINNPNPELWSSRVVIHNAKTGEEYNSDTFYIDGRLTLIVNYEK